MSDDTVNIIGYGLSYESSGASSFGTWLSYGSGTTIPNETIKLPSTNGKEGQILVHKSGQLTWETPQPIISYKKEAREMSTTSIIVIAAIVCFVMVKFVIPRLTVKNLLKAFWHLVYKPGKESLNEVKEEWNELHKETETEKKGG